MKTFGKKEKNSLAELKPIFYALRKKYVHSVYPPEVEDLEQTIWYLILLAIEKYEPKKGTLRNFAFYFSDQKLKDHFWRRVNLPQTQGKFTLLHLKATFMEEEKFIGDKNVKISEDLTPLLRLKIQGYTFVEISKKLNISYGTVRRKWKEDVRRIKESQIP